MTQLNIADRIKKQAEAQPNARAVVIPTGLDKSGRQSYTQISFGELEQRIEDAARGLVELGVTPGMRSLVFVKPSFELFVTAFALFRVGAVPVLLDPAIGRKAVLAAVEEAAPEVMIAVPSAQLLRRVFSKAFSSVKISVTVKAGFCLMRNLEQVEALGRRQSEPVQVATQAEDLAAILFTSGSTGPAKGVCYTHRIFDSQLEIFARELKVVPGDVDLSSFPLFSLFSVALGATVVIPAMDPSRPADCDGALMAQTIREQAVTYAFGSPSFWPRVADACEESHQRLPSLTRVMMAGAPAPIGLLARIKRLAAEGAELFTPYGATECLPISLPRGDEILACAEQTRAGRGNMVGRAIEGAALKIIRISDAPIPTLDKASELGPDEVGEIIVQSPVATAGYFHRPEDDARAKIKDGEGFWHRMGDLGYLDAEGRLWFCGRKSHRVESQHGPMYTVCCEAIFNQHPRVMRSALVGIGERGRQRPVMVIECFDDVQPNNPQEQQRLADELFALAAKSSLTREIEDLLFHDRFPVDARHNAKIRRELLAEWASVQLR